MTPRLERRFDLVPRTDMMPTGETCNLAAPPDAFSTGEDMEKCTRRRQPAWRREDAGPHKHDGVGAQLRTWTAAEESCPNVNITCKISAAPAGPTDTRCGVAHNKPRNQRGNFYVCTHEQKPYCRSPVVVAFSWGHCARKVHFLSLSYCLCFSRRCTPFPKSEGTKGPRGHGRR